MTVLGQASTFKREWVDGFVAAYGRMVRKVPGAYGILRTDSPTPGKVSVIIGGGCGHYPSFAGLVGPGLADGAVVGDVFTSPSAEQVYRTARAADGGAGVLFSYGNYQGDILHFGLAARRLAADGMDSRTVIVTDDVASGPADQPATWRGVAGDFYIFRIAAAAAERGDKLDDVAAIAEHANARTRTFGVAFGGCTMPGAAEPLFTVAPGKMELGLGIHGEPGIETVDSLNAHDLADALVDKLLPTLPPGSTRVAVLVNGLGRTKYEEMFVCYGRVDARLREAGLTPYRTEVGEFVTSLDMAGMSLTLLALDDELMSLLDMPCDSPAYTLAAKATDEPESAGVPVESVEELPATAADGIVARLLQNALDRITEREDELGALDAVAADGDHGIGMVRGMTAAVHAAERSEGGRDASSVGTALLEAGTAFADAAGGASGALYGVLLAETGGALKAAGDTQVTAEAAAAAIALARREFCNLGKAEVGDKTLLDALAPFESTLAESAAAGADLVTAWQAAAATAVDAATRTADLISAKGRAARLGERGRGSPDPGAVSFSIVVGAIGAELSAICAG